MSPASGRSQNPTDPYVCRCGGAGCVACDHPTTSPRDDPAGAGTPTGEQPGRPSPGGDDLAGVAPPASEQGAKGSPATSRRCVAGQTPTTTEPEEGTP